MRSVTSSVDANWEFYFVEPIERLEEDNNLENFISDVGLVVHLFGGIITQIESLEVPGFLSEIDASDINEIKHGLISAINKRIEVAETLIGMADQQQILEIDVIGTIEESNEYVQTAVNAYGSLLNRYK